MLELYGVDDPGQRQVLLEMAREGHRKGWWAVWDGVLPTGFGIYVGLEAEAASLRVYEAQVVHGLLQTEDYARAVMSTVRRRQTPDEIDRLVELRMQRQEVLLRADPLELWIILDEAVLRRMVGPSQRHARAARASARGQPVAEHDPAGAAVRQRPAPGPRRPVRHYRVPRALRSRRRLYRRGHGQAYIEERDREVRARSEAFDLLRAAAFRRPTRRFSSDRFPRDREEST